MPGRPPLWCFLCLDWLHLSWGQTVRWWYGLSRAQWSRAKPCHDLLYISGAFRRLYPVGTNAKSMSCWTENARRAERLSAWGR